MFIFFLFSLFPLFGFGREAEITILANYKKAGTTWGIHQQYKESRSLIIRNSNKTKRNYFSNKSSALSKLTFKGKNIVFLVPQLIDNVTSIIVREFAFTRNPKQKSMIMRDANNATLDLYRSKLKEVMLLDTEMRLRDDLDEIITPENILFKEFFCQKRKSEIACKLSAMIDLD